MKTEELTALGLTDEQSKAVFALNGKDITAEQDKGKKLESKILSLQGDIDTYKDKLKNFDGVDVENLKGEIKTLQDGIAAREENDKKAETDRTLNENIITAFGDKQFTSDYVKNGLIADIKSHLSDNSNAGKGITEIFTTLTKDKEGIFANPNPPVEIGGMGNVDTGLTGDNQARAAMGLPPAK